MPVRHRWISQVAFWQDFLTLLILLWCGFDVRFFAWTQAPRPSCLPFSMLRNWMWGRTSPVSRTFSSIFIDFERLFVFTFPKVPLKVFLSGDGTFVWCLCSVKNGVCDSRNLRSSLLALTHRWRDWPSAIANPFGRPHLSLTPSLWIQPISPNSRFRILFISPRIWLSCCCSFDLVDTAGSQLLSSTIIIRDCARQGCNVCGSGKE